MARSIQQELQRLRRLKLDAEKTGKAKRDADLEFKKHQAHVLTRMESTGVDGLKAGGVLFTKVEKVKGQVDDRSEYVRWALDNDEGLQAFIQRAAGRHGVAGAFVDELYEAVMNLELLKLKEDGQLLNQQARAHIDDGEPLPPGMGFRPDNYISQRKA
jgi:hypothetical protein